MLSNRQWLGQTLVGVLVLVSSADAVTYLMTGSIDQRNTLAGQQTYDLALTVTEWFPFGSDEIELAVVAPNGARFGEFVPDQVLARISGIEPMDLPAYYGTWTIEELLNGTTFSEYEFQVPTLLNSTNFLAPPMITSPEDGAVVGPLFTVSWTNADPHTCNFNYSISQLPRPDIQCQYDGSATFSYLGVPGFQGAEFTNFQTSVQVAEMGQLLPVTTVSGTGNANFVGGNMFYDTNSPPIAFTVVPESAMTGIWAIIASFVFRPSSRNWP